MSESIRTLLILSLVLLTSQVCFSLDTDKAVLIELKQFLQKSNPVTQGPYAKWNESDASPCRWHGIACDDDGERVTGVSLAGSSISGGIFPNFSHLTELSRIDLSLNTISGLLPPELNECEGLRYLNLSHNLIEGGMNLSGLRQLEVLDVTLNRLNGSIKMNFPCSSMVTMNLSMNRFSGGIDGAFDECAGLMYLDLSSNSFTGPVWQGFSSLLEFSVSENNLTGEINAASFSECGLAVLDLSSNSFHGEFPGSIANCSKLTSLNLWGNRFTGVIPAGIGSLLELSSLYLGNNSFSRDIPEQLLNCSNLLFLDLSTNKFAGVIQPILGRFRTLKFLVVHSNNYTGGIETSGILELPRLERLDISFNQFSGELPVKIARMPKLKFLILSSNNFSGSIPSEYGGIAGLQAMDLSFNRLTGAIPPAMGQLKSLLWLMLAGNELTGGIPPELGNCSSLLWLNLADNQLNGSIPVALTGLGSDPDVTFEKNKRDDTMPAGSGECLAMKRWLPATYPPFSFVYSLMNRKSCRSTWDRLLKGYGVIPICTNSSSTMQTKTSAGYVQLSGNRLSGEVPPEIGGMMNLSLIHLDRNQFSGELPAAIGSLRLVSFNASRNGFSGRIPTELGNMKCLNSLDLSWNNLSGQLPLSLNQLTALDKFNASYNPLLSGEVPASGQLGTFDDSFIGDPLITFASNAGNNSERHGTSVHTKTSPRMVAFWVFLTLTVLFFLGGVLSIIGCINVRAPTGGPPDPDVVLIDSSKRRSDVYWSTSSSTTSTTTTSTSAPTSLSSGAVKTTAFTYDDVGAATEWFSERRVIGVGGYGVVYRGVLPDGRTVAVKKLSRVGGDGEREFRAEMEVLAGVGEHPNLVTLYGWCMAGAERLLVYEYMEGGSLEELIGDWKVFGWRRRVEAAAEVARALAFLHPAVVHRDVKASNVLVDGAGRARVTDFGLARVVGAGESYVSTVVAGTVGYVAPEYGHTWRATTKGDVYSYGVLAMELATGRRAVDGGEECLVDWARRVASEGKVEAEVALEEMRALLRVGLRCAAEAPQARPDMEEVVAMLLDITLGCGGGGGGDWLAKT